MEPSLLLEVKVLYVLFTMVTNIHLCQLCWDGDFQNILTPETMVVGLEREIHLKY